MGMGKQMNRVLRQRAPEGATVLLSLAGTVAWRDFGNSIFDKKLPGQNFTKEV